MLKQDVSVTLTFCKECMMEISGVVFAFTTSSRYTGTTLSLMGVQNIVNRAAL